MPRTKAPPTTVIAGRRLLSMPETARRLGVGRKTVERLRDRGEIATIKIGSRTLVEEAEVDRFIAAQRGEAV